MDKLAAGLRSIHDRAGGDADYDGLERIQSGNIGGAKMQSGEMTLFMARIMNAGAARLARERFERALEQAIFTAP